MASYPGPKAPSARRRSPREGSVYEAPDGRWRGEVQWTDVAGQRHRAIRYGTTSEEARDKLDDVRRDLRLGGRAATAASITVGEYLDAWIERDRGRVRPSTATGRASHVRIYLVPALGRIKLARLTAPDVERAITSFMAYGRPVRETKPRPGRPSSGGISAMTARHIRTTLRRALADAVRDGLVIRNAAADARPPYVAHRPVSYLDAASVRHLLDSTKDHELGPLFALAASTGLRLGELLGLRWTDVDEAARIAHRAAVARARRRRRLEARRAEVRAIATHDPAAPAPHAPRSPANAPDRTLARAGRRLRLAGRRRPDLHRQPRSPPQARAHVGGLPEGPRRRWPAPRPTPRPPPLGRDADARRRHPARRDLRMARPLRHRDHGRLLRRRRARAPPRRRRRDGPRAHWIRDVSKDKPRARFVVDDDLGILIRAPLETSRSDLVEVARQAHREAVRLSAPMSVHQRARLMGKIAFARHSPEHPWREIVDDLSAALGRDLDERAVRKWVSSWRKAEGEDTSGPKRNG